MRVYLDDVSGDEAVTEDFKAGAEAMRKKAIEVAHEVGETILHHHPSGCTCGAIQMAINQIKVEELEK